MSKSDRIKRAGLLAVVFLTIFILSGCSKKIEVDSNAEIKQEQDNLEVPEAIQNDNVDDAETFKQENAQLQQ